jgi:hypothetical protein
MIALTVARKICQFFPLLSSVLYIEEGILLKMLTAGGFAHSSEKRGLTTNLFRESFLKEFMLDIEVSHFYIFKKWHLLVRFGAWDNAVHPKKKPAEIWSASLKKFLRLPRL